MLTMIACEGSDRASRRRVRGRTQRRSRVQPPGTVSIIASAPSVKFRNAHPVSTLCPAAPSPHTVLARIVEKSGAFCIVATFQTEKISAAEQVSGVQSERYKQLFRLIQFIFESPFELPRDYPRDARRLGDQDVDRINASARNGGVLIWRGAKVL